VSRTRWSALLTWAGSVLLAFGILAGLVNRHVLDGNRFADHLDTIRTDPAVTRQVGDAIVAQILTVRPDLVALRPLLQSTAATLVGSPAFGPLVRLAARDLHGTLTGSGDGGVMLQLADAATVVAAVVPTVSPGTVARILPSTTVTLLDAAPNTAGAKAARYVRAAGVLAWLLPLLALAAFAAGLWLAPGRRRAAIRTGYGVVAAGLSIGVIRFVGAVLAGRADEQTLRGALAAAAWREFGGVLWTASALTVAAGVVFALGASGRLPDLRTIRSSVSAVGPAAGSTPTRRIIRDVALIVVGVGAVLRPLTVLTISTVLAGLVLVVGGIGSLVPTPTPTPTRTPTSTLAVAPDGRDGGRRRASWTGPVALVVAAAAVTALLAFGAQPAHRGVTTSAVGSPDCNGHVELCGRRYDQVAYPATHNAMSAADDPGWFIPEQPTGLVGQLDAGIRVLLIDSYYGQQTQRQGVIATAPESYAAGLDEAKRSFGAEVVDSALRLRNAVTSTPSGPVRPYLCHGLCEIGSTEWQPEMARVKVWLDSHPREVVTFFIEDSVSPADTAAVFTQAGLLPDVYTPPAGAGWPTLGEMVRSGHRVVVLMERHGGGADYPWLRLGFDVVQDTPYTNPTIASLSCTRNRGAATNPLFLVNYWLSNFRSLVSDARTINAYDQMWPYVARCQAERHRLPNYVAVNFYNEGDLFRVVDRLNGFG
jgi:hypothetical protein